MRSPLGARDDRARRVFRVVGDVYVRVSRAALHFALLASDIMQKFSNGTRCDSEREKRAQRFLRACVARY